MIPLVLALASAGATWFAIRTIRPPDPLLAARLAALRGPRRAGVLRTGGFPALGAVTSLGARLPGNRAQMSQTLAAGGYPAVSPEVLAGFQGMAACAGLVLGMTAGPLSILAAPGLAFAGYRLPAFYLSLRARARKDEVTGALPDAVDLLVVCMQGGLNLPLSLTRVAGNTKGLLGKELGRTVEEIDLGVPRAEALLALAERNPSDDMAALVGTLVNADRFGGRVASALENFAGEIRRARRRKAEEQARRAPVKILFPMVFLILPAFLVLTVIPVVMGTLHNIGF